MEDLSEYIVTDGDYRSFPLYSMDIKEVIIKQDRKIEELNKENKELLQEILKLEVENQELRKEIELLRKQIPFLEV